MKRSKKEKEEARYIFSQMTLSEKADHIFTYYKAPLLLILIVLIITIQTTAHLITKKTPAAYLAEINVALGEDAARTLNSDFLREYNYNPKKQEIYIYKGLYVSEDPSESNHSYAYASAVKLTGAIESGKLDLVLMNREAYDLLSGKGYLMDMSEVLHKNPSLSQQLTPYITSNKVVLSDNSLEVMLNEAERYEQNSIYQENGLVITDCPKIKTTHPDGDIYLGIIANSSRLDTVCQYMEYLTT